MEVTRAMLGVNWPHRLLRSLDKVLPRSVSNQMISTLAADEEDFQLLAEYLRALQELPSCGEITCEYIRRNHRGDKLVLWDRLSELTCHVSLVFGQLDDTVPGFDGDLLEQLHNAQSVGVSVVKGGGHSFPCNGDMVHARVFVDTIQGIHCYTE